MIIEYRSDGVSRSLVKRTYKDVHEVSTCNAGITHLRGLIPAVMDPEKNFEYVRYAQTFFIAAINLAPGEYLECVDVPRD
jgi:hypothetical protein